MDLELKDIARELLQRTLPQLLSHAHNGFRAVRHEMPFPTEQGFLGPEITHIGDVFQRAILAEALASASTVTHTSLDGILDREIAYLISCRRMQGVCGWSYFPGLLELPPDADDLAQVIIALVACGRPHDIVRFCLPSLSVLLEEDSYPDGAFETWIVPRTRNAEQELQVRWIRQAWGWGPDAEVMANLLYALHLYDALRFQSVIRRGAEFLASRQADDGSWKSTWYHGHFYGTWMCLRLFCAAGLEGEALRKGLLFLQKSRREDGAWGWQQSSDPLSTAFALMGLSDCLTLAGFPATSAPVLDASEILDHANLAALYLRSFANTHQEWPDVPFIRMELGRPTGRPWQVLSYGNSLMTAAFVMKAACALLRP